ncbi:hypothetical protein [Embleya sp. NPDC005575]|uniref:RICIN domain-containing protein n=1 Tax=Embleya sp. NPDC005575 TaxID=3156892 RepID=UPI00339FBDE0
MKKKRIAKFALATAAIPAMIMGASSPVYADSSSFVTWRNGWSGEYLCDNEGSTDVYTCANSSADGTRWLDGDNGNGTWKEIDRWGRCLTAYWNNRAYVEPCSFNGANTYQQWREISTGSGWKLQNVATGYILDQGSNYSVYANSTDYGDSNSHQRWH